MLSPVLFYPQYWQFGFLYINKHVSWSHFIYKILNSYNCSSLLNIP